MSARFSAQSIIAALKQPGEAGAKELERLVGRKCRLRPGKKTQMLVAQEALCSEHMQMATKELNLDFGSLTCEDLYKLSQRCPAGAQLLSNFKLARHHGLSRHTMIIDSVWANFPALKWAIEEGGMLFSRAFMEGCLIHAKKEAYGLALRNLDKLVGCPGSKDTRTMVGAMDAFVSGLFFQAVIRTTREMVALHAAYGYHHTGETAQVDVKWVTLEHRRRLNLLRWRGVAKAIACLCALRLEVAQRIYAPGAEGFHSAMAEFDMVRAPSGAQNPDQQMSGGCSTKKRKL